MFKPHFYDTLIIVSLLTIYVNFIETIDENDTKTKLQIGIKYRVKNCSFKSKKGDFLHVHFTTHLENGTEIESTKYRGTPLTFSLGSGQVIKGWDQGLIGMCEGEKRKLVIPPELAYGKAAIGSTIPSNATLMFEILLEKIGRK